MHMKFSRNRGDRISNLHDLTGNMTPVPAVLGLSHPNRPVIVLFFLLVIFLSGSLPPAAATAVRNCFGTLEPGSSTGEDEATSGGKYRTVWPKYVAVYINYMCTHHGLCDVHGGHRIRNFAGLFSL